jgi:hypothetical protein
VNRRALSLGGFVVAGVSQAALGISQSLSGTAATDPLFLVAGGLLLAGVFGRALVRGDDLNGLARRPLFVAVGVVAAVVTGGLTALALLAS